MPETIDEAVTADNTGGSSAQSTDNAASGSASADNSISDQPVADSADAGSVSTDNLSDAGNQAPSHGNTEAVAVTPTPASPYGEKQYREVQSWATKVNQTNIQLQQQLQELQRKFDAAQNKQSEPQLRPWDEGHAEHAQFLRLVDRAEHFEELIQGEENPEIIKALQQKQMRVLGDQGVQMLRDWRDNVRSQERERRLNPKAFYSKLIRQEAQPVVQETLQSTSQNYQQMIQARDQAQKWIQGNPEVATPENIKAVIALMENGVKFDQASAQVERDHYRNLVSNAKKMSASAEEKERLLQGNAAGAIHRNPNASKKVDVGKLRKDKGIQNGRQLIDELFDLDSKGLL